MHTFLPFEMCRFAEYAAMLKEAIPELWNGHYTLATEFGRSLAANVNTKQHSWSSRTCSPVSQHLETYLWYFVRGECSIPTTAFLFLSFRPGLACHGLNTPRANTPHILVSLLMSISIKNHFYFPATRWISKHPTSSSMFMFISYSHCSSWSWLLPACHLHAKKMDTESKILRACIPAPQSNEKSYWLRIRPQQCTGWS